MGIPKGNFYYSFNLFIRELFKNSDFELFYGMDNDDEIYELGNR